MQTYFCLSNIFNKKLYTTQCAQELHHVSKNHSNLSKLHRGSFLPQIFVSHRRNFTFCVVNSVVLLRKTLMLDSKLLSTVLNCSLGSVLICSVTSDVWKPTVTFFCDFILLFYPQCTKQNEICQLDIFLFLLPSSHSC